MQTSLAKLNHLLIYLILILVNVAYLPQIVESSYYSIVTTVITGLVVSCVLFNFFRYSGVIFTLIVPYVSVCLLVSSIVFFIYDEFIFTAVLNVILSIICFIVGYTVRNPSEDLINKCINLFIFSAIFMGLFSVYHILGRFEISIGYAFLAKNSSGVLLGTAAVLSLYKLIVSRTLNYKLIYSISFFVSLVCLITFRCRSAMVALILIICVVMYKNRHSIFKILRNPMAFLSVLALFFCIFYFNIISFDYIYSSFFENKDVSDLNSVSSGRLDLYQIGLSSFYKDFVFGNISIGASLPTLDNYIINVLSRYGFVGGLLLFPIYFYLWVICFRGLKRVPFNKVYPFVCLLLLLIVSLFESTYPFGPGTPVICAFYLLGIHFKNNCYL